MTGLQQCKSHFARAFAPYRSRNPTRGTFPRRRGLNTALRNQEDAMTDYRDPNYRDPNRPGYRDPIAPMDQQAWSSATWGWIAGIAVVVLVLIFAFGGGREQTATETS